MNLLIALALALAPLRAHADVRPASEGLRSFEPGDKKLDASSSRTAYAKEALAGDPGDRVLAEVGNPSTHACPYGEQRVLVHPGGPNAGASVARAGHAGAWIYDMASFLDSVGRPADASDYCSHLPCVIRTPDAHVADLVLLCRPTYEQHKLALVGTDAATEEERGRAGRRVFIDLGANWANTLRLYEDLPPQLAGTSDAPWEVYAFEASPLITPYVDRVVEWLNGERPARPELCLPPSGSSAHLSKYAPAYGCPKYGNKNVINNCMFKKLDLILKRLAPEPRLREPALIEARLARARAPPPTGTSTRYTLVPAAAGAAAGEVEFYNGEGSAWKSNSRRRFLDAREGR
jgi:hypothetical protein